MVHAAWLRTGPAVCRGATSWPAAIVVPKPNTRDRFAFHRLLKAIAAAKCPRPAARSPKLPGAQGTRPPAPTVPICLPLPASQTTLRPNRTQALRAAAPGLRSAHLAQWAPAVLERVGVPRQVLEREPGPSVPHTLVRKHAPGRDGPRHAPWALPVAPVARFLVQGPVQTRPLQWKSHVDSQFYHTAFRGPPKGRNAPTMLARILPARGVFAGARAAAACHARRAHTQASGGASDQAVTIQKMSTEQWAEAFKKVRPSLFPRVPLVAAARLRDGPANTPPIPFLQPRPRPAAVGVGVWVACWSCPLRC